ncbi:CRACD-like protein [Dermacentor albipictus]|uniref:CRACD-like protein n=1 Tax=Dermacentor albipictus TaxID=60249 RepID=UPI0031FD9D6D
MPRTKPRSRRSSQTVETKPQPNNVASGAATGTSSGTGTQSRKGSAQHDPPVPILSSKRRSSRTQRRPRRKSADAAEKAAEPKVDATSTAPRAPTSEGGTEQPAPATEDLSTVITSGIGQYLQSLLPTMEPTEEQESLQQPPSQQPLISQHAPQLMPVPQQALTQQAIQGSPFQPQNLQQSPFMPPMAPVMSQPSYPQPSLQQAAIPQTFPYAYGGMLPPWYGLPQQMHLGQAPFPYLPPTAVQPAPMATAAPPMLPNVPPSVSAVPAASLEPAAAGPPEPKQPTKVVDRAPAEAASTSAAVPDARESKSKGAEPVPDASLQDPDAFCALPPPTLADQSTISQSQKKSHPSRRHRSRRHVELDDSAFDSNVATSPSRTTKADHRAYVSKVPRKHRSYSKSFQYEDESDEKDGKDTAFASDHRTDRQYSVHSHSGEDQVDELAEGTTSPVQSLKSPPKSKGRSKARAAKQRKSVAAASESLPASSAREDSTAETDLSRNSSTSSGGPPVTNVSGIDREILKKLIEAIAARRQAPSLQVSPRSEKEQEHKGKCQHTRGLRKDRHHHEKKEREQKNSEDFFEEIVEEIVEPQNGAKGGPQKRLVRKTTKMRTHNVTEEPCRDERGQSSALPLVDRVEAMRSRFSGGNRSPSDKPCRNGEDDNSEPTATTWRQNARNRYLSDWPRAPDYDEQADSTEFEPESLPLRAGQRYFKPSFTRQPMPPWYRAAFAPGYLPRAATTTRPYRLFRPIPCFDCATVASHFRTCADQRLCCQMKTFGCVQAPRNATLATGQCMSTVPSRPLPLGSASAKQASRPRRVVYRSCPPPPGLPVIDNPCWSTGATWTAGTGDKDAPCGCCQGQSVAIDDLDQRQLSLEEVLRHEDSIRFDAQLEDRRRLLDEERIREEERLAFREYLIQRDEVLNDDAGRLPNTPLQEFKEALQRELAKRRDARAMLEAARSQAAGSMAPQVAAPSSGQARLGTEVKAKEASMPGALKLDPDKQGYCANRRTSHPSLQLGASRRASFALELETIVGTAPSSPANVDATKAPTSK